MVAQKPSNTSPIIKDRHEELIDASGMQAIRSMYSDRAAEVIKRLSEMDLPVRNLMLKAIIGAHRAIVPNNRVVAEIIQI